MKYLILLLFISGCSVVDVNQNEFCGSSTYGYCESSDDCIRAGCSQQVCQNVNEENIATTCEWKECYTPKQGYGCGCMNNKCQWFTMGNL